MRHIRVGIATSLMVGTPFVMDYAFPQLHSVLLIVPLYPGVQLTDFFLNLLGGSAFDQAGDIRPSFAVGMVALSAVFWFVAFHGAGALWKHVMQR